VLGPGAVAALWIGKAVVAAPYYALSIIQIADLRL
jgi:hypothetical protein